MTVVTPAHLNHYMNSPEWTEEQKMAVGFILRGLESELSGHLSGANITPRQMHEVAPVLSSGLVATRQPVFTVLQVDGVAVDDDNPLQLPWVHTEHRLRHTRSPSTSYGLLTLPSASTAWGEANIPRVDAVGQVTVTYMGGWGINPTVEGVDNPALIDTSALFLAILKKAKAVTNNRFDDRIGTSSGAENENVVRPERENWNKDELAALGIFRNIGAHR